MKNKSNPLVLNEVEGFERTNQFSRSLLKEILPSNAIIVEAGAHIGRDTVKLATLFPAGTIYAFEPNPIAFEKLVENVALVSFDYAADYAKAATPRQDERIHCFPLALSDTNGSTTMHVCENISALSSLHAPATVLDNHHDAQFYEITVQTITLDSWAEQHHVQKIDFIWLDIQGHELAALQGAQNILKTIQWLLVEVNLEERYKKQPLYHEVAIWLKDQGFKVYGEYLHHGSWGNVLFKRTS